MTEQEKAIKEKKRKEAIALSRTKPELMKRIEAVIKSAGQGIPHDVIVKEQRNIIRLAGGEEQYGELKREVERKLGRIK